MKITKDELKKGTLPEFETNDLTDEQVKIIAKLLFEIINNEIE
jgi:predicted DNA binding protein